VSLTPPSDPSDTAEPLSAPLSASARKPFLLHLAPIPLLLFGLQTAAWGVMTFPGRGSGTAAVTPLILTIMGGLLLAAAWGFWANRLWARSLVVGWGMAAVVALFFVGARMGGLMGAVGSALPSGVVTVLMWSYLYDSRSAVAYYARLEEEEEAAASG
jgi:hypothetical protein